MTARLLLTVLCLGLTSSPIPHSHEPPSDGFPLMETTDDAPTMGQPADSSLLHPDAANPDPDVLRGDLGPDAPQPVTEARGTLVMPAPRRWTPADVHAAIASASPRARCIVTAEIGGVGFNPYAVGSQGEQGPAQLHPRGLLTDFRAQGYPDPNNPWQAVAYLESAVARGMARHWSPVIRGIC